MELHTPRYWTDAKRLEYCAPSESPETTALLQFSSLKQASAAGTDMNVKRSKSWNILGRQTTHDVDGPGARTLSRRKSQPLQIVNHHVGTSSVAMPERQVPHQLPMKRNSSTRSTRLICSATRNQRTNRVHGEKNAASPEQHVVDTTSASMRRIKNVRACVAGRL